MTAQVVTTENLVANTKSTDVVAGANMTSVATTDTCTWTPPANRTEDCIIAIAFGTSATVTITAGVYPPGVRGGLGNVTLTGTTSEVRLVMLEGTRVFSNAKPATVVFTVAGNTCKIGAFRIPRTV